MLVKPEYIHIALHLSRLLSVSHYNGSDLKCNPVRVSSILPILVLFPYRIFVLRELGFIPNDQ